MNLLCRVSPVSVSSESEVAVSSESREFAVFS